jgi:hypothetical protein
MKSDVFRLLEHGRDVLCRIFGDIAKAKYEIYRAIRRDTQGLTLKGNKDKGADKANGCDTEKREMYSNEKVRNADKANNADVGRANGRECNIGKTNGIKSNGGKAIGKTNIEKANVRKANIGKTNNGKANIEKSIVGKAEEDNDVPQTWDLMAWIRRGRKSYLRLRSA